MFCQSAFIFFSRRSMLTDKAVLQVGDPDESAHRDLSTGENRHTIRGSPSTLYNQSSDDT
jgi:hypothetical protein